MVHNDVGKYGDFARCTTDFFTKDFPTGSVKVEARTQSRSLLATRPGGKWETFSDEFKVSAARDLATGAISAEVKNTTCLPIANTKSGIKLASTMNWLFRGQECHYLDFYQLVNSAGFYLQRGIRGA